jgi:site-specific DNA recombinase
MTKTKLSINELNEITVFEQFAKGKKKGDSRNNNCIIYTRVSTKEQELGYSLGTQRKECEELAIKNGYSILGYFGGTYESAKTDERKEFNRMLQFAKRSKEKVTYIIVHMVDRFSRSGANAIFLKEQLKQTGIYIMSVKQPVDVRTTSGDFQQNIQIIFSHYDNQVRRERCMAGTKEALSRGEWCSTTPKGYDRVNINGKSELVVNATGKIIRKAFLWKANEGISNEECRARLAKLGLKVSHQRMSHILKNPFYCGLIAHNALEGKIIEGRHEKLISKDIFLKVNQVQKKNPHGYKHDPEQDNVPLKVFLKCDSCEKSLTGYVAKKKGIWYYKCRNIGCCNNKSAKQLNEVFYKSLSYFTLNPKYRKLLREMLLQELHEENKENLENVKLLKSTYQDINHKIERLEERYINEELSQELYVKYGTKYKQERLALAQELTKLETGSSNLENEVDEALDFSENISKTWHCGGFKEKQRVQYFLFPNGIRYNRKKDTVRTDKYNPLFLWIARQQQDAANNKNGIPELSLEYAALVENIGVEPTTSCMPCKRSSQLS